MKAALNAYSGALPEHSSALPKPSRGGAGCPEHRLVSFLARHHPALLVLDGPVPGLEISLDQARFTLGRGPGVDLALDHACLIGEAVALEFNGSGFALQGANLTSCLASASDSHRSRQLCHGDRFKVGDLRFEYTLTEGA